MMIGTLLYGREVIKRLDLIFPSKDVMLQRPFDLAL